MESSIHKNASPNRSFRPTANVKPELDVRLIYDDHDFEGSFFMNRLNRKSTPKVVAGQVQKKNNWQETPTYYNTAPPRPEIVRKRPGKGYRHLLRQKDIYDFIEILFTESTARAHQLLATLLHELGHHHDRITTKSKIRASRGEGYAESYAKKYANQIWERYIETFGLP
jgi:hypothetical protein